MSTSRDPTLLEQVRNAVVTYKGTVGNPVSLADVGKIARVEPITLVSSDLNGVKDLYNILHGVLNIYTAYYLQAVSILSAQLNDVRILKILDRTNPDRDMKTLLTSGQFGMESYASTMALESAKYALPFVGMEARAPVNQNPNRHTPNITINNITQNKSSNTLTTSIGKLETFEKLGMGVGKVVEVKFNSNSSDVSIPVSVKLDTMVMPGDVMTSIMTNNKDEITLGSRFKDAISGRISFIKDFLLASDLIKNQKKSMMKDPTGYYSQLLARVNNSKFYSVLSGGNISLAGVSSIAVISEQDEANIQRNLGGKLTNKTIRNMVFDNMSVMMIVVIDKEWERVTIYVRDIDDFSQNSFDSFKKPSEGSGAMISDMVKAFSMNNAPSF